MAGMVQGGAWRELRASGEIGRFALLCAGVWLHAADSLVTATIVPAIVEDIGGVAYVGWTIALYQIGAIVAGAATAMLCRRVDIKRVQAAAALLYGVGCVLAAVAPNMAVLLAARLVQGVGGGMLLSLSDVAIQRSFPEHLWSPLFGIIAIIWSAGSLLGPLIGGVFAAFGTWRWAFWIFAGQAGVLWLAATLWLESRPLAGVRARAAWPLASLLTLAAATGAIAAAGVVERWPVSVAACLAGMGLLHAAAGLDRRSASPLLPARALNARSPAGAGLLMVFTLSVAATGFWAYGPLLLKIMFGIAPLVSGFILAGEALAWSFGTLLVSGVKLSAGPGLIRAGAGLVVASTAALAFAVPAGSIIGMVLCTLVEGFGFGICWPSIVTRTVRLADEAERGLAATSAGTVQRIGYAVGAAASGIAANASGLADGISIGAAQTAGFWVFAGFIPVLAIGAVAAWRFTEPAAAG